MIGDVDVVDNVDVYVEVGVQEYDDNDDDDDVDVEEYDEND